MYRFYTADADLHKNWLLPTAFSLVPHVQLSAEETQFYFHSTRENRVCGPLQPLLSYILEEEAHILLVLHKRPRICITCRIRQTLLNVAVKTLRKWPSLFFPASPPFSLLSNLVRADILFLLSYFQAFVHILHV